MELSKIKEVKPWFIVRKLYSSIYKRLHSWGIFLLLLLLYSSSLGLQSSPPLQAFGRLGLMTIHVYSGFGLILVSIVLAYGYVHTAVNFRQTNGSHRGQEYVRSKSRMLVDLLFYTILMAVCLLGLIYFFLKEFSISSPFLHQSFFSILHVIAGWFFLSLVFVRYYLTWMKWLRDLIDYLREY